MLFETQENPQRSILIRTAFMAGAGLVLLILLSVKSVVPAIEKELLSETSRLFIDKKLNNVLLSASGQDIYLEGLVSTDIKDEAILIAKNVRGVRMVYDNFIITDSKKAKPIKSDNLNK